MIKCIQLQFLFRVELLALTVKLATRYASLWLFLYASQSARELMAEGASVKKTMECLHKAFFHIPNRLAVQVALQLTRIHWTTVKQWLANETDTWGVTSDQDCNARGWWNFSCKTLRPTAAAAQFSVMEFITNILFLHTNDLWTNQISVGREAIYSHKLEYAHGMCDTSLNIHIQ